MQPVVTPAEMRVIDAAASDSLDELIDRAGWAVAMSARRMLGSTYGKRIAVLVGKGNNGADGRVAERVLRRWGARTTVYDAVDLPQEIVGVDLVIDACFGTGFRGEFAAPLVSAPVLAVDVPSGVDALTGRLLGRPLQARRTVSMVAAKPGLLLEPGRSASGELEVVDLGLETGTCHRWWLAASDIAEAWPQRSPAAHKWDAAVLVVGGRPGMTGAPSLAASAAARAGAGMVVLASSDHSPRTEDHLVTRVLDRDWDRNLLHDQHRFGALVVGPGLPTDDDTRQRALRLIVDWVGPVVVDAGAIDAVVGQQQALRSRKIPAVLTPHEGEFARLGGSVDRDRIEAVESLALDHASVVLLKGSTTVVAEPGGSTYLSTAGDQRLATAGSGDVLAGVIGAGLSMGLAPGRAAALGAELHGRAAQLGPAMGQVASDLPRLVSQYLSERGRTHAR